MTKVVCFSNETFDAVKATPEAFDDERMLGSFNMGPVVCRIVLSYDEDDEGYYDGWPNLFMGKYVIEALIDFVGWECYEKEDIDCEILEGIPLTCMGDFPVFLEETYEETMKRFQHDFYECVLNNEKLTKSILASEITARRFIESLNEEMNKNIQKHSESSYMQLVGDSDTYIAKLA